jgi:hypothetical protein
MPYENAPETIAPGEEEKPPEEMGLGDKVLHGAAMFGNEATMGVVPALATMNPEAKQRILKYLREGEEELGPGLSRGIKVAGAFATPLPGLGAIKGVTTLGKIGAAAARGAISGGIGAGVSNIAQQSPGGIDVGDALKSAGIGAVGGGVIGGALGAAGQGIGKYLSSRAEQSIFSAGGGTRGTIAKLGRYDPMTNSKRAADKADEVAKTALKEGWVGNFGKGIDHSVEMSGKAADLAGQRIENVMLKHGNNTTIRPKSEYVVDNIINDVTNRFTKGKIGPTQPQKTAIVGLENELKNLLGYVPEEVDKLTGAVLKPAYYNVSHLDGRTIQQVKDQIGSMVYGFGRDKTVGNSALAQTFAVGKSVLSDMEDKLISAIDKGAGKELVDAKRLFHHAKLWEGMGRAAKEGERGLIEHLGGRGMRSIPDTYIIGQIMKTIGAPSGPITNQLLANLIGRGRIPNTMLAAGKLPAALAKNPVTGSSGAFAPMTTQRLGSMIGRGIGNQ